MIDMLNPKDKIQGNCEGCKQFTIIVLLTGTPATSFRKAWCAKCAPKTLREMELKG